MSNTVQVLLCLVALGLVLYLHRRLRHAEGGRDLSWSEVALRISQLISDLLQESVSGRPLAIFNFVFTLAFLATFVVSVVVVFSPSILEEIGLAPPENVRQILPVIMFAGTVIVGLASLRLLKD